MNISNPCVQHTYKLSSMIQRMTLNKEIYVFKPKGFSVIPIKKLPDRKYCSSIIYDDELSGLSI